MQMINSTILEFATRYDPSDRKILKDMVCGTMWALVGSEGRKPHITRYLLGSGATE